MRDITFRALDVLGGAALVLAEDTRVTRKLFSAYGLSAPLMRADEHEEASAVSTALKALGEGRPVALVSDAGTPLVSDPGYRLVRAAIAAGHKVIPIPGASAPLAALVAAGIATDRFLFAGFPPAKQAARKTWLDELAETPATLVFFESGPRLAESLADMAEIFGPRSAAIARELTKLYEEVRRGDLSALANHYAFNGAPRGEIVIVVDRPDEKPPASQAELDAVLREELQRGGVKEAAAEAAKRLGVARKLAYARALALRASA